MVLVAASFGFAGLICFELTSTQSDLPVIETIAAQPEATPTAPHADPSPGDELRIALAAPLFSPSRKRPNTAFSTKGAGPELPNLRLTGIVIERDRRIAIFAADGKPLIRTEGESLSDWRIETVSAQEVALTGPTGITTLGLKPDPNLVRRTAPALPATRGNTAIMPPVNAPAGPLAQGAAAKSLRKELPPGPSPSPPVGPAR